MKTLAFALAATLCASPLLAEAIEEKNIVSGKVKIEPDSGYIYLHGPSRQVGMFLKMPDEKDIAEYTKDWEEAFVKAQGKHEKAIKRWEGEVATAKQLKQKLPAKPEAPTRENFSIGSIEARNPVPFGPEFVYSKDKAAQKYAYLIKVKPGTYNYYGGLFVNPQNGSYFGECVCMGSIQFEVKPGTITDLGNFLLAAPYGDQADATPDGKMRIATGLGTSVVNRASEGLKLTYGAPDTLKAYRYAQADIRAAGKQDNYFGVTVNRLPPIAGILAYERDKVVDLRAAAN